MDFRDRLLSIMKSKKLTQKQFADKIGITTGNLSMWLNPKYRSKPTFDVLAQISNELNVNANWLLTGQGSMFAGENQPDQNKKIEELEAKLRALREQIAALEAECDELGVKNKELNDKLIKRFEELLGLQVKMLELKS